jgi:hypothetical protein
MNLRYSLCRRSFLIAFSVYVFILATIVHVEVPLRWELFRTPMGLTVELLHCEVFDSAVAPLKISRRPPGPRRDLVEARN